MIGLFTLRREHVEVHAQHHRDEDDRVVKQVQLDAGNPQLHETYWHGRAKQVVSEDGLRLQQRMLDMVPELYSA